MVEVRRVDSIDRFVAEAGAFLAAREAEHNLLLGICSGLQVPAAGDVPPDGPTPDFLVASSGGQVVLAAVRTPPYNLVLSEVGDGAALDALADELAGHDLPGVLGPAEHAGVFAARWCTANGRQPRLATSERIFRLTAVRLPPLPPGRLRPAAPVDRPLIVEWYEAFGREALLGAPWADAEAQVDRRLAEGGEPQECIDALLNGRSDGTVLCSHGDLIPKVIRQLVSDGMRTKDPNLSQKGSVWVLEMVDGKVTSGRYNPPALG